MRGNNTDSDPIEVSIVMPCLDEAETVANCVREAKSALEKAGVRGEVVVSDNGSQDDSRTLAEQAGARVVSVSEKGYGNALMGGIASSNGKYVLMGDADVSYDFGELPRFLGKLRDGADLVLGCRLSKGGGTILPGAMPWKHRWIGNPILTALGRLFFEPGVDDFHCGLRAFRKDVILALDLQCTGMEFASEMIVKASLSSLQIEQVAITLRPDGRNHPPHLRSWRDGWRHLRFMLLFTPKWLFLIPGLVLSGLSATAFSILLWGPVTVGGVEFSTNTLLVSATGILVGFQVSFFGVYTKAYAVHEGLLPPDKRIETLLASHPIESGIVLGLLIFLAGLAYLIVAVLNWQEIGFGGLSYEKGLRIVIPAVTAIALGIQIIFSGFAFAILGLRRKRILYYSDE